MTVAVIRDKTLYLTTTNPATLTYHEVYPDLTAGYHNNQLTTVTFQGSQAEHINQVYYQDYYNGYVTYQLIEFMKITGTIMRRATQDPRLFVLLQDGLICGLSVKLN